MSPTTSRVLAAALLGQALGMLGWIDPLFIPLVLAGPLVVGASAAARRVPYALGAVLWASAGLNMMWTDWVVNRADVGFHLVLSVLMPLLAGIGFGVVRLSARHRGSDAPRSVDEAARSPHVPS